MIGGPGKVTQEYIDFKRLERHRAFAEKTKEEEKMITELKVGDYIEKSELDTEQKYNDVVSLFCDFGVLYVSKYSNLEKWDGVVNSGNTLVGCFEINEGIKRKLTYNEIMSLKKVDVDNCNIDKVVSGNNGPFKKSESLETVNVSIDLIRGSFNVERDGENLTIKINDDEDEEECFREDPTAKEMLKSAKAVLAMESLGHEWDEEKGQWFRKEYF